MRALLEIPQLGAKLYIPSNQAEFHVGKDDIKKAATIQQADPSSFDSISSVKVDPSGKIIKEHFIIHIQNGSFSIEDQHSTNGTYFGSKSLKGLPPQKLKDGDQFVIPIQQQGKLTSLIVIFRIVDEPEPASNEESEAVYVSPQMNTPQYNPPKANASSSIRSASKSSSATSNPPASSGSGPVYAPIPTSSSKGGSTPSNVKSVPIQGGNAPVYQDPNTQDLDQDADTSGSFILVQDAQNIPADAFAPNSGVDLSMVYRLEKSELWHIFVGVGLLFLMIFHTYINISIITLVSSLVQGSVPGSTVLLNQFLIVPMVLGFTFAISFIIHELSHLYTGKHFKYQSRFCLTNVGFKATKRAALIGYPFGLPGAAVSVGVDPVNDKDKMGWIKTAGPSSNAVFGTILLILAFVMPAEWTQVSLYLLQGATLNYILGAFNLIPIELKGFALDGKFISGWNKRIYVGLLFYMIFGTIVTILLTQYFSTL